MDSSATSIFCWRLVSRLGQGQGLHTPRYRRPLAAFGDVLIAPGDYMVDDHDGLVRVPKALADEVADRAEAANGHRKPCAQGNSRWRRSPTGLSEIWQVLSDAPDYGCPCSKICLACDRVPDGLGRIHHGLVCTSRVQVHGWAGVAGHQFFFGFHSRANFCASEICAGVMRRASKSRTETAWSQRSASEAAASSRQA